MPAQDAGGVLPSSFLQNNTALALQAFSVGGSAARGVDAAAAGLLGN